MKNLYHNPANKVMVDAITTSRPSDAAYLYLEKKRNSTIVGSITANIVCAIIGFILGRLF